MSSINPSFSNNYDSYLPKEPPPIKESPENANISAARDSGELSTPVTPPPFTEKIIFPPSPPKANLPALPVSHDQIEEHKEAHQAVNREVDLQAKLQQMGKKGVKGPGLLQRVVEKPFSKSKQIAKKGWENKLELAEQVPLGVGFLVEGVHTSKDALQLRKEAREVEKSIKNRSLSKEERNEIKSELKGLRSETKAIEKHLNELDKAIAKDYDKIESGDKTADTARSLRMNLSERKQSQDTLEVVRADTQTVRRKLYDEGHPDLDNQMAKMDQLNKERRQKERKGFGHTSRGLVGGGYAAISAGKIVMGAVDISSGLTTIVPVVGGVVGIGLATMEGGMHLHHIKKASSHLSELKQLKYEGKMCRARALSLKEMSNDPSLEIQQRKLCAAQAEVELVKADLIEDDIHNQQKVQHIKKTANTLGFAESAALMTASTFSLLSLIPEPTTAATMASLSLGATGVKYGLMFSEWAYDIGSEIKEEKKEKKLQKRRDFEVSSTETTRGSPATHDKGISKSFLGVEIRMAAMMKLGILPSGVQKYHRIIDEKGYVSHIDGLAQELGDKQAVKKGKMVITDFADYINQHYEELAENVSKLSNRKAA